MGQKRTRPFVMLVGAAAAFAMLVGLLSVSRVSAASCFPDASGHWAESFICWMADNGLTTGYPDGTYRPNNSVSRAEMAVFLQNVHRLDRFGQTWSGTGLGLQLEGTNPNLSINSTNNANKTTYLGFSNNGTLLYDLGVDPLSSDNRDFYIYDWFAGRYRLFMSGDGATGINTNAPDASLHVVEHDTGIEPTILTSIFGEGLIGVHGVSDTGTGVSGTSKSFVGGWFDSGSGDLIRGYDNDPSQELRFVVENDGDVKADGSFTSPADFAELMQSHRDASAYEAGDVLVIQEDGKVGLSEQARDTALAGVFSRNPGFVGDERISQEGLQVEEKMSSEGRINVAILGIVPVKVTDQNGAIQPGDLLTTADAAGRAMKCQEPVDCFGAVIGKALEAHAQGEGKIRVLVTLR